MTICEKRFLYAVHQFVADFPGVGSRDVMVIGGEMPSKGLLDLVVVRSTVVITTSRYFHFVLGKYE